LTSSDERVAAARAHGADELVNHGTGDLKAQVAGLIDGKGVDVCFDSKGGRLSDQALSSLAWATCWNSRRGSAGSFAV
jgi:NADPH2:quinone reductase